MNYLLRRKFNNEIIEQLLVPKSFKLFLENFEVGSKAIIREVFFYKEEFYPLTSLVYQKEDYSNGIPYFYSLEEIKSELSDYKGYRKDGFIRIGYFDEEDKILLKVEGANQGEIWKENGGDWGIPKPDFDFLEDNIFVFLSKCNQELIKLNLIINNIKPTQLYRNWGEDFWRVREEENN